MSVKVRQYQNEVEASSKKSFVSGCYRRLHSWDFAVNRENKLNVKLKFCRSIIFYMVASLREKWPNTEFFLVRIFQYSDWIRRDTPYRSVFSPNAGKGGPEKTPCLSTFHAVFKTLLCFNTYELIFVPYATNDYLRRIKVSGSPNR